MCLRQASDSPANELKIELATWICGTLYVWRAFYFCKVLEVCHAISGTLDDRRADHGHRVTQRFSSHLNDSG